MSASIRDVAKREYWLVRILRMHVLDRGYFEILAGRSFASDRAAIRFYLRNEHDAALGLSLNPLIEKDWLRQALPETDASWYALLLDRDGLFSTSPYFDAAIYAEKAHGRRPPRDTLEALRHFLAQATPMTNMPSGPHSRGPAMNWSEYRERALADANLYVDQLRLRRQRTTETWDEAAAADFLSLVRGAHDIDDRMVSIIMPTRDRRETLREAIRSVQEQTHENWELIVIDDGSTDGTGDYLRGVAASDARIRPVIQSGTGVSAARNRGLSRASGHFVAFLDSDNTWFPHFLEYSLAGMRFRGARVVHSGMRLQRDDDAVRYRGMPGTREDLLYAGNFLDLNAVVLEKSLMDAVGGFDETIRRWVDYDLFLSVSAIEVPSYLPFLGVDYDDHSSPGRITGSELPSWEDVVVGKHLIDWVSLEEKTSSRENGMVSVIIPTYGDWRFTATAVRAVLDNSGERVVEIIVIDNGSRRHVYAILDALFGTVDRVRIVRMPRNLNFALANDYALSLSNGEYVVALNNDTEVTPDWLDPLVAPMEADQTVLGTQPLLLYPDGTIQTAGTVFFEDGSLPRHFLTGHPVDDLEPVRRSDYSAVTAAALCMRAADLITLHGFDPLYTNGMEDVDLCLRALRLRDGAFHVITDSVVYHHEGKTPDRARAVTRNRTLFLQRWTGSYPPSDEWRYESLGLSDDGP